jgi:hypothetical protein
MQHVLTCNKKEKNVSLECFWELWKVQNEEFPKVPPEGQMDKWKALKPGVKAAPKWAQRSQESIWESGREVGREMGQESE